MNFLVCFYLILFVFQIKISNRGMKTVPSYNQRHLVIVLHANAGELCSEYRNVLGQLGVADGDWNKFGSDLLNTMVLKLYKLDPSPPARACMMACELFNVPVEMVNVDLLKAEHMTPEFLQKNPTHTIPVLEDGDFILHESGAILIYLAEEYGKNQESFYPKSLKQRARVNQMLFFASTVLFTRLRNITIPLIFRHIKPIPEESLKSVDEAYGFLEEFLSRTKYVAGNEMTIADLAAYATTCSLGYLLKLDVQKYPKIYSWLKAMEQQPFAQKQNAPGAKILQNYINIRLAEQ